MKLSTGINININMDNSNDDYNENTHRIFTPYTGQYCGYNREPRTLDEWIDIYSKYSIPGNNGYKDKFHCKKIINFLKFCKENVFCMYTYGKDEYRGVRYVVIYNWTKVTSNNDNNIDIDNGKMHMTRQSYSFINLVLQQQKSDQYNANLNIVCDEVQRRRKNVIVNVKYHNIFDCCINRLDEKDNYHHDISKISNLFCWGNHERQFISWLLNQIVPCLQGLKPICEIIGRYCTCGNDDNIDSLFNQYLDQIKL